MGVTPPPLQRLPPVVLAADMARLAMERYQNRLRCMAWRDFIREPRRAFYPCGLAKSLWEPIWDEVYEERTLLRPAADPGQSSRDELLRGV